MRCNHCGGSIMMASIKIEVEARARVHRAGPKLAALIEKKKLNIPLATVSRMRLKTCGNIEEQAFLDDTPIHCGECGSTDLNDSEVCIRCGAVDTEPHYCYFYAVVICSECRDGYICRNDCRHRDCEFYRRR